MPSPQTQLAGATMACECVDIGCKDCGAGGRAGRAYVFPDDTGVRVPCPSAMHSYSTFLSAACSYCQQRGWIASRNGWVWWRAIEQLGTITDPKYPDSLSYTFTLSLEVSAGSKFYAESGWGHPMTYYFMHEQDSDDPEAAFFAALTRAVVAMGATLLEVADA